MFSGGAFDTYEGSALHAERVGSVDASLGYCGLSTEGEFLIVQMRVSPFGLPRALNAARALAAG